MSVRNLDGMMAPRSVALIGASARPGTLGSIVMERLTGSGFRGDIGFVNPRYQSIAGRPCVARVAELPFVPDLAVMATPAATVPALVGELGEIGTRAAVVISAGFTSMTSPRLPTSAISIPANAQRGASRSAKRKVPSVSGTTAI